MIKLFSLKQQKKDGESSPRSGNQKKPSAAQLRIAKGDNKFFMNYFCLIIHWKPLVCSFCMNHGFLLNIPTIKNNIEVILKIFLDY